MQKKYSRTAVAVSVFLALLWAGCGGPPNSGVVQDTIKNKIDSEKLDPTRNTPTPYTAAFTKSNRVKVKSKPTKRRISMCIIVDFDNTKKYDSLVLDIYMKHKKNSGDSIVTKFAHLTFTPRHTGINRASLRVVEKEGFSLFFTSAWYLGTAAEDGVWCKDLNCTIKPANKCSDENAPVAVVQSTTTSGSTATVSVDEQ